MNLKLKNRPLTRRSTTKIFCCFFCFSDEFLKYNIIFTYYLTVSVDQSNTKYPLTIENTHRQRKKLLSLARNKILPGMTNTIKYYRYDD